MISKKQEIVIPSTYLEHTQMGQSATNPLWGPLDSQSHAATSSFLLKVVADMGLHGPRTQEFWAAEKALMDAQERTWVVKFPGNATF